ncbi:MAG: PA2779 family protein [Gammaproteobacteria bacterium]|nr:PA2779 family protein [Pseudomonadales bacterium]MCP5346504.1 PA2779 family protein [Pseudomonadales bacterium]
MLADMGVDAQAARDRVATLSAEELEQLSNRMDELPAGEGALGTIALVLVILILLDVAGVTDIFPSV